MHHHQQLFNSSSSSRWNAFYSRQYGLMNESAACELTKHPVIRAVIKFKVTLQCIWLVVLNPRREQGCLVWSICPCIRSSKKSERKMGDELTGKWEWEPLLAANLAKHSSTAAKHICVSMWSFLRLHWRGSRNVIINIQGLLLCSAPFLAKKQNQILLDYIKD